MKPASLLPFFILCAACDDSSPNTTPGASPTSATTAASTTRAPGDSPSASFEVELAAPRSVEEGQTFSLEAVVKGADAGACRFSWAQNGVKPKAAVPRDSTSRIDVLAPEWTANFELVIQVSVSFGEDVVTREATIQVSANDDPPRASFVAPQSVECGELVSLVGQTHNEPYQETLVEWRQIGDGPRVEFDATARHQAYFFAPEHETAYSVGIEFRASDKDGEPVLSTARIDVICDSEFTPLPKGSVLVLPALAGVEHTLPRGVWELEGSLTPKAGAGFEARLRFASGDLCAALMFTGDAEGSQLATAGLSRTAEGAWVIPAFKSGMPLGPWPKDVPLGFVFASDGREVSVRFGPAGAKNNWPEMPFDIVLPIGKRPRTFAVDVVAGDVQIGELTLRAP